MRQNAPISAEETLTANTAGTAIAASYSGGVLTLSGSDTAAEYPRRLAHVVAVNAPFYHNYSDPVPSGTVTFYDGHSTATPYGQKTQPIGKALAMGV
jgi:hypothetical protein